MADLVVDEQLGGGVQALQEHQLVGLRGNSVRERRPDAPLGGPQPHAEGEGPQRRDRALDNGVHVVGPGWEGEPEALWEGGAQHTCREAAGMWDDGIRKVGSELKRVDVRDVWLCSVSARPGFHSAFLVFFFFFFTL